VIPALLNELLDASEPTDLRIGAFVIVRNAMPSYVTLQAIVHRLHMERSSQLRTLMYTSLVSMAKYKGAYPQLRRLYAAICCCCLIRWRRQLWSTAARAPSTSNNIFSAHFGATESLQPT